MSACSLRSDAKGNVKVRIVVAPEGIVSKVKIVSTPNAVLGACVKEVVMKAVFDRTELGGSFSHTFVF